MENETVVVPMDDYPNRHEGDLVLYREPDVILKEAKKAAVALTQVISMKKKPVMFGGEQYLEFEDWQTVAKFYGLTAKVVSTSPVQFDTVSGFEARAVVVDMQGREVSSADSMCLNDEDNWSTKAKYEWKNGVKTKVGDVKVPLFQLRSMAQTRACAKALRNVLSWVVVLAGYRPTVAEEMTEDTVAPAGPTVEQPKRKSESAPAQGAPAQQARPASNDPSIISELQAKRLYAIANGNGFSKEQIKDELQKFGYASTRDIKKADYETICKVFEPFGNDAGGNG